MEGLTLVRGGRPILSDVTFQWNPGDTTILIGPNGAGKTSLLRCMIGMHADYRGRIHFDGRDLRSFTPRQRACMIGYEPQVLDTDFNVDVKSFMASARYAHSGNRHSAIIKESLALTETTHLPDAFLDELSGGERSRVMIAAALAQEPKVLLLDEPNAHLDPKHTADLVRLLSRLHGQNMNLVVVAHDWNPFLALRPQVLALSRGELFHSGNWETTVNLLPELYGCAFTEWHASDQSRSYPTFEIDS